ncbi:MAG: hypothetical protein HY402_05100 [Elusimicrobia bacterium]|nr:hypothetical protein [Elusimicrobiota bacterium]
MNRVLALVLATALGGGCAFPRPQRSALTEPRRSYSLDLEGARRATLSALQGLDWPLVTDGNPLPRRLIAQVRSGATPWISGISTKKSYYLELSFSQDGLGLTQVTAQLYYVKQSRWSGKILEIEREDPLGPKRSKKILEEFFSALEPHHPSPHPP